MKFLVRMMPCRVPCVLMVLLAAAGAGTGQPPGGVINHSPARTRQYIGSPSLAVLPGGEYVASHDYFGPGSSRDTTLVFASRDEGNTWELRATIKGQWWSTLFTHRDGLYLLGTTKEYGHCVIRRSLDGGRTWSEPRDENSGLLHADGMYHCAPVPVIAHQGRLWRAMEEYTGPKWGAFKAFVMSVPEDADLLHARNWTSSNRIGPGPAWLGGQCRAILEGNVVVAPDGSVVNLLRVDQPDFNEVAALMRVSADGRELTFDPARDFVALPGAAKKFTIRYDPNSKQYWTLANAVPADQQRAEVRPAMTRNTLALLSSADLRTWQVRRTLLRGDEVKTMGFQYVDWLFAGADLIAVVRTAFPEPDGTPAHNAHDANWLIFLRIPDFRRAE